MNIKKDVGPDGRLLRELRKQAGRAAVAAAAPYVKKCGDEFAGLLVTREGGLAALEVIRRGLAAFCRAGGLLSEGCVEAFRHVREVWGLQWGVDLEDQACALRDQFDWDRERTRYPECRRDLDLAQTALHKLIRVAADVSDGEYGALDERTECGASGLPAPETGAVPTGR